MIEAGEAVPQRCSASILTMDLGRQPPPYLIDCRFLVPAGSLKGFVTSAVAATEAPGAALSNQPIFIRYLTARPSKLVVSSCTSLLLVFPGCGSRQTMVLDKGACVSRQASRECLASCISCYFFSSYSLRHQRELTIPILTVVERLQLATFLGRKPTLELGRWSKICHWLEQFWRLWMVGIDRGWRDGSTVLLGIDFDFGFGKTDPPFA